MSKKKLALIINIIIIIVELLAFGKNLLVEHNIAIEYYTNDSNILALISSILFIIFYNKNKEFVKDIRFIATSCLTVTLLVVIFILSPMYEFNYKLLMFTDNFFILHTLAPILSIISYVALEDRSNKNYLCLAFTTLYAIIMIVLNVLNECQKRLNFVTAAKTLPMTKWTISIFKSKYSRYISNTIMGSNYNRWKLFNKSLS